MTVAETLKAAAIPIAVGAVTVLSVQTITEQRITVVPKYTKEVRVDTTFQLTIDSLTIDSADIRDFHYWWPMNTTVYRYYVGDTILLACHQHLVIYSKFRTPHMRWSDEEEHVISLVQKAPKHPRYTLDSIITFREAGSDTTVSTSTVVQQQADQQEEAKESKWASWMSGIGSTVVAAIIMGSWKYIEPWWLLLIGRRKKKKKAEDSEQPAPATIEPPRPRRTLPHRRRR